MEGPSYPKIINQEFIPYVHPPKDTEIITAVITGDTELTFGRQTVDVAPEINALNALIINRRQALYSEELRQKTDTAEHPLRFLRHLGSVAAKLSAASGAELVEADGTMTNSTKYQLSDKLLFIDQRDQIKDDFLTFLRNKFAKVSSSDVVEQGRIRHHTLTAIVRHYTQTERAKTIYFQLLQQNAEAIQQRRLPATKWPTPEESNYYLTQIRNGISEILEHNRQQLDTIFTIYTAYNSLYFRHLHFIHGLVRKYQNQRARRDELFQEGSLAFYEFLTTYVSYPAIESQPTNPHATFVNDVLSAVSQRMSQYDAFEHNAHLPDRVQARRHNIKIAVDLFADQQGVISYPLTPYSNLGWRSGIMPF